MFDIGFWELAIIGVVALLVIGPERLPAVARTTGLWLGRGRRFLAGVKADIDREIKADELKRIMKEQAESSGIHEIVEETRSTLDETRESLAESRSELDALETGQPERDRSPGSVREPVDEAEQTAPEQIPDESDVTEPQARKDANER